MKFNCSVLLFISAIFAQSHEDSKGKECYNKMECKTKEITGKIATDRKYMRCAEFVGRKFSMARCIYKVAGVRDDQINLLFNIMSISTNCGSGLESQFRQCIEKCVSDKSCKETCSDNTTEKNMQCLANQFNVKDFDARKSVQCSNKCDQDTLSEILDCDTKCNEPLYKKLESEGDYEEEEEEEDDDDDDDYSDDGDEDSMLENGKGSKNSTIRVTITTKSDSNNPKFTSRVNTSSTNSSITTSSSTSSSSTNSPSTSPSNTRTTNGVSSLSTGLFSAISIPILLSLIFIV
jgi:hypothetical protein